MMKLIEVIRGLATTEPMKQSNRFLKKSEKCRLKYRIIGFVSNRVLIPMLNEAMYCVMEGATPEAIDTVMKLE
jgi:3-hydroxybutyryl-CoA dehydrogenase